MRNVVAKFIGRNENELNQDLIKMSIYYGFDINVTNCFIQTQDKMQPNTLNPLLDDSAILIDKIFDCLLPHFKSEYVNIGFDETFDLGKGQTEDECKKRGIDEIYAEYLLKIYKLSTEKYNKKVMIFADIAFKYPRILTKIPKDCILLEWGYDLEHHYDRDCRSLKEFGFDFYVSPGTSSWGSLTGRNMNLLFNIHNAAENGKYHSAKGFMLTDWGDNGHMQFSAASYPAYVIGAAFAWNAGSHNTKDAYEDRNVILHQSLKYLDLFIFNCNSINSLSDIIWRLGNYYLLEDTPYFNNTKTSHLLQLCVDDISLLKNEDSARFSDISKYVISIENELNAFACGHGDTSLIASELKLSCKMVNFHAKVLEYLICKVQSKSLPSIDDLFALSKKIKPEYKRLWDIKNHEVGSNIYINFLSNIESILTETL